MTTLRATDAQDLIAKLRSADPLDTIVLAGEFSSVELQGIRPEQPVTITSVSSGGAHFEGLRLEDCANLILSNLTFWPLSPVQRKRGNQYLLTAFPNCSHIEVSGCTFRGRIDSDNHPRWTLADWNAGKIGGVLLRGPNSVIRNCTAVGVQFGYGVTGRNSEIFGNSVFGFSGDGLRATEDNCVIVDNRVTDAMQIDDNHSDGLQAFKTSGLLNGIVVKDNTIIEWTVRPDNPLRARVQGIGFHNGPYANVVIRDNAVSTRAPNGIHLNAVYNLEVTGNRLRNADGKRGKAPWIRVNGCSGRMVVENNEAEQFKFQRGVIGRFNRAPDYSIPF